MTHPPARCVSPSKLKLLLLASSLLAAGAAAARAWSPPIAESGRAARSSVTTGTAPRLFTPAGGGRQEVPQTELVTVTPTGFDPGELTRPAGRFILAVENRSGLEEVTLVLRDGAGQELLRRRVEREQLDWSGTLDLAAGTYLLAEEGHPAWACTLTLTTP